MRRARGFTLIELLVALTVAILLITVAVPGFTGLLARQQMTADVNRVTSTFQFARSEVIKRRASVIVKLQAEGDDGKGSWRIDVWKDREYPEEDDTDIRQITGAARTLLYPEESRGNVWSSGHGGVSSVLVDD